ncbi:hypothetical protein IEQ34_014092 [Dendrobium chrysotoxum]|uniref:Uncharacterized protein n=1 Tax=Dendrobium chrysotoxum TaxID=161865 RepID=A0AAV7GK90_DENCH|nr:hypothetical protein IEQ34_014092 [Dendrobium chrysotoxum]
MNSSSWNSSEGDREDKRPILYRNPHEDSGYHQEVIVKIGDRSQDIHMKMRILISVVGGKVWKESNNEFRKERNPNNDSNESKEDDSDTYNKGRGLWRGSATASPAVMDAGAEVLRCSSNSFFRRRSNMLLRAKTRSRLMDPPSASGGADERKSMQMSNRFGQLLSRASQFSYVLASPNWDYSVSHR